MKLNLHMCPTFSMKMDLVGIIQNLHEYLNRNLRYISSIYTVERERSDI